MSVKLPGYTVLCALQARSTLRDMEEETLSCTVAQFSLAPPRPPPAEPVAPAAPAAPPAAAGRAVASAPLPGFLASAGVNLGMQTNPFLGCVLMSSTQRSLVRAYSRHDHFLALSQRCKALDDVLSLLAT